MLVYIGVVRLSNNGSFRFLNNKMAQLIDKFKLMKTCEATKHTAVGHKSQKMFLRLGTKNMRSMSKTGSVVIPKRIHLLESLESDFKNTILKMTSDRLVKSQKKSSVAKNLNTANIYDASQIRRLSSVCNIEKGDTTITSSRDSTIRNDDSTLSYSLVIMRLQSQVLPLLIENYGITLAQWKMDVDTNKVESILKDIVRYANEKR